MAEVLSIDEGETTQIELVFDSKRLRLLLLPEGLANTNGADCFQSAPFCRSASLGLRSVMRSGSGSRESHAMEGLLNRLDRQLDH